MQKKPGTIFVGALMALAATPLEAQTAADAARVAPALATQREEMSKLANYDGVFAGKWQVFKPDGSVAENGHAVHRIGPFLGGTIKMIEGRFYSDPSAPAFRGMIVLTYNIAQKAWKFNVFGMGGSFEVMPTLNENGYSFNVPGGSPENFKRIVITVTPTSWAEQIYLHRAGEEPFKLFDMHLDRVGPSDWPLDASSVTSEPLHER